MALMPSSANDYKQDFERYVDKATILIHSPQTTQQLQQSLSGPDPVQKVADATVMVMQRLDDAARRAGIEVQDSIRVFGAYEIVKLVVELGAAAKKFPPFSENLVELALSVAVQDYVKAEVAAGRINAQQLQVSMQTDLRKLPPQERKKIQQAQLRIQQTARQYNGGKGMMQPDAEEVQEDPQEEATEAPDAEAQEEAQEPMPQGGQPMQGGGMMRKKGLLGGMQ